MNPPAFQFYAKDFLISTTLFQREEVGDYIRLLSWQWDNGHIPQDPAELEMIARGKVSARVLAKFHFDAEGRGRNQRLEMERQKQADYREKQRQKGILSGAARRTEHEPRLNHGSVPVRTGSEPEANRAPSCGSPLVEVRLEPEGNSSSSSSSSSSTPTSEKTLPKGECEADKPRRTPTERSPAGGLDEVKAFFASNGGSEVNAMDFFDHYEANGWMQGKVPMKQWKAAARRWCRGNVNGQRALHLNGSRYPPRGQPESKQIQEDIQCPVWSAT